MKALMEKYLSYISCLRCSLHIFSDDGSLTSNSHSQWSLLNKHSCIGFPSCPDFLFFVVYFYFFQILFLNKVVAYKLWFLGIQANTNYKMLTSILQLYFIFAAFKLERDSESFIRSLCSSHLHILDEVRVFKWRKGIVHSVTN
jgi:hypothetical protein